MLTQAGDPPDRAHRRDEKIGAFSSPQSALSHQLRVLEERLGLPLFLPNRRRMELTPAGQRLLASAETIHQEMELAGRELAAMRRSPAGRLRVSTECTTCYHWLPAVLSAFQKKYSTIEVEINIEATRRPFTTLLSGELDAAIVYSTRRDRRIAFRELFKDELVIIIHPEHRLAARKFTPNLRPKLRPERDYLPPSPASRFLFHHTNPLVPAI
ncbi:MAG: LysR family transcriptional regulator [Chthoniobacterales bacterium]|nr:LysR family transcriptional regulator [Chthoniobacterales bacterium]